MDHRGNESDAGYTDKKQIATPGTNPASGYDRYYFKSDDNLYKLTSAGVESQVGGALSNYNTVLGAMSGTVHRWKFTEASGNFADSIGSLTLTVSGSFTYAQTAVVETNGAVLFGASAKAVSSGMGSIPTGSNARTIACVVKNSTNTKRTIFSYGTASTRLWWTLFMNETVSTNVALDSFADDLSAAAGLAATTTDYHLIIARYDGNVTMELYIDGFDYSHTLGGALNTSSGGNFQIGQDTSGSNQFDSYMDDITVFNRRISNFECAKLWTALTNT